MKALLTSCLIQSHLNIAIWIVFALFLIHLNFLVRKKKIHFLRDLNECRFFQLSAFDSFLLFGRWSRLNLYPKFSGSFWRRSPSCLHLTFDAVLYAMEKSLATRLEYLQIKVREFWTMQQLEKLEEQNWSIKVIDVDPKKPMFRFKASWRLHKSLMHFWKIFDKF